MPKKSAAPLLLSPDEQQAPLQSLSPEVTTQTVVGDGDTFMLSDYPAVQTNRVRWSPENVDWQADGSALLSLTEAPDGAPRPYLSGEIASTDTAAFGTWSWKVQVPDMVDGAVFGMFTFQADPRTPRIEYDIEFVGDDTTRMEVNIHMARPDGRNVSLAGGPQTINLGFDAAKGVHDYAVTVTATEGIFLVDGKEVARFDASDMPDQVWRNGEMRSYVDLWPVAAGGMENWAGTWAWPGAPLVARVVDIDTPDSAPDGTTPDPDPVDPVDPGPVDPGQERPSTDFPPDWVLDWEGRVLRGTAGDDRIAGLAAGDLILAMAGNDTLMGSSGNDGLDGGSGIDLLSFAGSARGARVNLASDLPQDTRYGRDVILNVENLQGGDGADALTGDQRANLLDGGAGSDTLRGADGSDVLIGGAGRDRMDGGQDDAGDTFVFRDVTESGAGRGGPGGADRIFEFQSGTDRLDLSAIDADLLRGGNQAFGLADSAAANSVWISPSGGASHVLADVTGDAQADLRVIVRGLVVAEDLIL